MFVFRPAFGCWSMRTPEKKIWGNFQLFLLILHFYQWFFFPIKVSYPMVSTAASYQRVPGTKSLQGREWFFLNKNHLLIWIWIVTIHVTSFSSISHCSNSELCLGVRLHIPIEHGLTTHLQSWAWINDLHISCLHLHWTDNMFEKALKIGKRLTMVYYKKRSTKMP